MKKTIKTISVLALFLVATIFAANAQYENGSSYLNVGVGLGGGLGLPIGVSYEKGITDNISVGGYAGYASSSQDYGFGIKSSLTYIIVGARGSYHFTNLGIDKLDPYVGALLGYNIASSKVTGAPVGWTQPSVGGLAWGGHAGARYAFTDKFGGFAEVGYGIAYLTVGLSVKF
jgi:hypothetical protein